MKGTLSRLKAAATQYPGGQPLPMKGTMSARADWDRAIMLATAITSASTEAPQWQWLPLLGWGEGVARERRG